MRRSPKVQTQTEIAIAIDGTLFTNDVTEMVAAVSAIDRVEGQEDEVAWLAIEDVLEDGSVYESQLRADAGLHFIVITDEDQTGGAVPARLVGPAGDRMKVMRELLERDPQDKFDDAVVSVIAPMDIELESDPTHDYFGADRHKIGYAFAETGDQISVETYYWDTDNDGDNDWVDVNRNASTPDFPSFGFSPSIEVEVYSEGLFIVPVQFVGPVQINDDDHTIPMIQDEEDYVFLALDPMMPPISQGNVWDWDYADGVFSRPEFCEAFAWATARRIDYQTRIPGDANGDGVFNSSDFVVWFSAAKYETGEIAEILEGDANGDYFFDTSDFVYLFALGHYDSE
ncbi:hypothetical protein ACFL2H_10235 [Planctomycetota bacterium]